MEAELPVKSLTLVGEVPHGRAGRLYARIELKGGGHTISLPLAIDLRPVLRVLPTLSVLDPHRRDATEHRIIPSAGVKVSADRIQLDFDDRLVRASVRERDDDLFVYIAPRTELASSSQTDVLVTVPNVSRHPVVIPVSTFAVRNSAKVIEH